MSSSSGNSIRFNLFGESHGEAIGITIEGLPAGKSFDFAAVELALTRRQGGEIFNTPRQESIDYDIVSGFFNDQTTGSPLTILFPNKNTKSKDYSLFTSLYRPGTADYVASKKYANFQDFRGGGHFSGRLTAPIVFAGELMHQLIAQEYPEYSATTYVTKIGNFVGRNYYDLRHDEVHKLFPEVEDITDLAHILEKYSEADVRKKMEDLNGSLRTRVDHNIGKVLGDAKTYLEELAKSGDSIGGQIEAVVTGVPAGIGEPFFNSIESEISKYLFSIGSVQAVSFGLGTEFVNYLGSGAKDEIIYHDERGIQTLHNFNGGINGGISNGEDIVTKIVIKPISSIKQQQYTYNHLTEKIEPLEIEGRHDATIVNRIFSVMKAMIHLAMYDLMLTSKREVK